MIEIDKSSPLLITIDGLSGSGKGTLAKALAQDLGTEYFDSGSLYRVVALLFKQQGEPSWENFANYLQQLLKNKNLLYEGGRIYLADLDLTDDIRSEEIGLAASTLAQNLELRKLLLPLQRSILTPKGLVTDGRDMGQVVFPEAILKIFLTSSLSQRALRRYWQLEQKLPLATIEAFLGTRDKQDASRNMAQFDPNFKVLDNSNLDVAASISLIKLWLQEKQLLTAKSL